MVTKNKIVIYANIDLFWFFKARLKFDFCLRYSYIVFLGQI